MLILLIGPKGSGKTHVGRLLESKTGVHFFHVEPLWMQFHADCVAAGRPVDIPEGISRIHPQISASLESHEHVCVETTGASPEILRDLLEIGERSGVVLVRVAAPWKLCTQRIEERDPTYQITVDPEMIRKAYDLSVALELPYDVSLDNIALSDGEIMKAFHVIGFFAQDVGSQDRTPSETS